MIAVSKHSKASHGDSKGHSQDRGLKPQEANVDSIKERVLKKGSDLTMKVTYDHCRHSETTGEQK